MMTTFSATANSLSGGETAAKTNQKIGLPRKWQIINQ